MNGISRKPAPTPPPVTELESQVAGEGFRVASPGYVRFWPGPLPREARLGFRRPGHGRGFDRGRPHGRPGPLGFGLCGRLPRHGVGGFMFNASSSRGFDRGPWSKRAHKNTRGHVWRVANATPSSQHAHTEKRRVPKLRRRLASVIHVLRTHWGETLHKWSQNQTKASSSSS